MPVMPWHGALGSGAPLGGTNFFLLKTPQKIAATRAALFDSNMHQLVCRLGLRPRPHWRSLQRSPRPPSCIWGAYF